jgi:hypothetical protein
VFEWKWNRIQVTYYDRKGKFVLKYRKSKPSYNLQEVVKLNNHSKIGWQDFTADQQLHFWFLGLDKKMSPRVQSLAASSIANSEMADLGLPRGYLQCELRPNNYLLVHLSTPTRPTSTTFS